MKVECRSTPEINSIVSDDNSSIIPAKDVIVLLNSHTEKMSHLAAVQSLRCILSHWYVQQSINIFFVYLCAHLHSFYTEGWQLIDYSCNGWWGCLVTAIAHFGVTTSAIYSQSLMRCQYLRKLSEWNCFCDW